ncbi:DUF695 domain-containing protein [Flavobacteriaceae bacterium Ap0902]|nr:DUF695 domain-containing protein [Flavobacteriaceae bacterium Ap0902]
MEINQDWAYYYSLVQDKPASIRLNLALAEVAPIEDYALRTWFSVKLLNPDENGLTTNEEFEKIGEIEDAVSDALANSGAIFVGTIKNNGMADFYFYSKEIYNYKEIIHTVMSNYKEYRFAIDTQEDATWSAYFDFLYPSAYEMQTIRNRKVLMQLDQLGDDPEKERKVDHWIYFKSEKDRDNFIKEAEILGYHILSLEKVEGEYPYQLNIDRLDNTIWDNVDNYVWELVTIANENNGYYDGWGSPIMKEE